jgi:hypothetical protein
MATSFVRGIHRWGQGSMGARRRRSLSKTLARARTQRFAMFVAAARSSLTFALLRPKEKEEKAICHMHACKHTKRLGKHFSSQLCSCRLQKTYSRPVPAMLISLSVSHYISDQ